MNSFLIILTFIIFISSCNKKNNQDTVKEKTEDIEYTITDNYLGYEYVLMSKDNKSVVLFPKNFLPRNDVILVGAIKSVISKVYDETIPESSKATLENRNGMNLLKLKGKNSDYYVQLIKEDTGEIHTFILWGEDK
ncbi:MAG: hypothetical protein M3R36_05320 [Bacteroidota bacterium]|nr:hypothetical protein [Bacteroidota bacterium]